MIGRAAGTMLQLVRHLPQLQKSCCMYLEAIGFIGVSDNLIGALS